MRPICLLVLLLATAHSKPSADSQTADVRSSVVRINSTRQSWNPWQPWEKNPPEKRRALAAIVGPQRVLTTSELVADSTFLEFESADGTRFTRARVVAVDYEANLALLGPEDDTEGKSFFKGTVPFEITTPRKIGSSMQIVQVEENGSALKTAGILQSIDLTSSFLPGQGFLTYMVKASMQSAAGSFSLPVLDGDKLAGVLISYNSKDQICDVTATDIVLRFLKIATNGQYKGFPSLGVVIARTDDAAFRQWLKLGDDQGGVYIHNVRKGGAAETAGVKKGDVLLAVDGQAIDRRGYYQHPFYGNLSWGHLIRGGKTTGDTVTLSLWREGVSVAIKATLTREENTSRLVPVHLYDRPPGFLVKGGLIFRELSLPVLQGFGEDWESRAPLDLLDAWQNPDKYETSMDRVIFLGGVIPTPATVGYENLPNMMVRRVNGQDIRNMKSLVEAFSKPAGDLHHIEFVDENLSIQIDPQVTDAVDAQLLERGIPRLSRTE
jgi:PDZ domain